MRATIRVTITERLSLTGDCWMRVSRQVERKGQNQSVNLWLTVSLVAVLDLVTTYYGLQLGFFEVNPIARTGLGQFGFVWLVLLKAVALGIGGFNYRNLNQYRYLVPTTFILAWGAAVLSNLALILNHTA